MSRRTNFSEAQKAAIYVRDRAHCGYTGECLWLLDQGIVPNIRIDWVDHVVPVAHGGTSSLENGVCASHEANWAKGDRIGTPLLLRWGEFVGAASHLPSTKRKAIAGGIERFSRLDVSDWFLNRAFFRVWCGAAWIYDVRVGLAPRKRDDHHYAKCAMSALRKWRRKAEGTASLEARGLVPREPRDDHRLLLSLRDAQSEAAVLLTIRCAANMLRDDQCESNGFDSDGTSSTSLWLFPSLTLVR